MTSNKLFCDCKKCECKKCPDILKNLNITVTRSRCYFNKAKTGCNQSLQPPCSSKNLRKYDSESTCHSNTLITSQSHLTHANDMFPDDAANTGLECLDCGIVARAMKAQIPLEIGKHLDHNVKRLINKARMDEMADIPKIKKTISRNTCLKRVYIHSTPAKTKNKK